jgi:hypothetical protein
VNVPPYIPEPIEVPGNVADERHHVRLRFVRRVQLRHALTLLVILAIATLPVEPPRWELTGALALVSLLGLSIVRQLVKAKPADPKVSLMLAPLLFFSLGLCLRELSQMGWPVWTPLVGVGCAVIYGLLSGRDYSFLGMLVLSLITSSTGLVAHGLTTGWSASYLWYGLLFNALYLIYYVSDLAALQTRRRLGEEWGAVMDLYRDVLNALTYSIRVWKHWRKHRIWSLPR